MEKTYEKALIVECMSEMLKLPELIELDRQNQKTYSSKLLGNRIKDWKCENCQN